MFIQRDQLVASPDGATYLYDTAGLRTTKTVNGMPVRYTWDRTTKNPVLLAETGTHYLYGPLSVPLAQTTPTSTLYLHPDRLGSVRAITSTTGAITTTRTYTPYGTPTSTDTTSNFGYAAEYADTNTNLTYLRARYYQPSSGQFITEDPAVAQTKQPYLYTNGDPINHTDPSGLCPDACVIEGGASIGIFGVIVFLVAFATAIIKGKDIGAAIQAGWNAASKKVSGLLSKLKSSLTTAYSKCTDPGPSCGQHHTEAQDQRPQCDRDWEEANNGRPPGVPGDYESEPTRNGNGTVWRAPGSTGDADTVRIMDPGADSRYPDGYVVFRNGVGGGQPLDVYGKPGTPAETHIPIDQTGHYPVPDGWDPPSKFIGHA